jgi:hypothetical protein
LPDLFTTVMTCAMVGVAMCLFYVVLVRQARVSILESIRVC